MAINDYLRLSNWKPGQFRFADRGDKGGLTTLQVARLVQEWAVSIGTDPAKCGTHSLRPTKAVLVYRRTGNLRAVQHLLGHTKIESTVRNLGIEVDDAVRVADCSAHDGSYWDLHTSLAPPLVPFLAPVDWVILRRIECASRNLII